jgi:hypothetical protein
MHRDDTLGPNTQDQNIEEVPTGVTIHRNQTAENRVLSEHGRRSYISGKGMHIKKIAEEKFDQTTEKTHVTVHRGRTSLLHFFTQKYVTDLIKRHPYVYEFPLHKSIPTSYPRLLS